ncbi:MAG TPA: hypothetical protein DFR83_07135, partial [Deltaproteobacteria bacterium]|nr:hypothetical protein [Deltaproteobacteria bacterium]
MPQRVSKFLLLLAVPLAGRAAPQPDARGTAAPARPYDILSLHLDIEVDPAARTVQGTARYRARVLHDAPLVLNRI